MAALSTRAREAIKTALAVTIAYGIALQLGWEKPMWAGFAVAMVSQATAGQSLNKATLRTFGTLVAAVAALTILALSPQDRWLFMVLLSAYVSFVTYMMGGSRYPYFWQVCRPRQVQAMMMAHKGKVVFEIYPGMNAADYHVWVSASKTTVGLMVSMLADEGKIDLDRPVPVYVPELGGSAWDNITMKNAMNMSVALDNEETFESLSKPDSRISTFFTAVFTAGDDPTKWRKLLKRARPLPNEKPGDRFRYSTSITEVLVLAVENLTQMSWEQYWNERAWSKIGARSPFIIGLTPDGTPIAGGLNFTTAEDMLRYALIYTPSWKVVTEEQIISDKLLKLIQAMGDPAAYKVSTELEYGQKWFGETPMMNTAQWDHAFPDCAMFKHGNMGQGIYVDPARDFCGMYFGLASNDEKIAGIDHSPGYLRAAAKMLAGR